MIREERREISLFDEANLAVYYLTRDAMMAEYVTSAPGANSNVFLWINQHSLDRAASPLPNPRIYRVVNYYIQVAGPRLQLMRDEWDSTQTIRINQTIITDKLDTTIAVPFNPFMFSLDPISNPVVQRDHHIRFVLELRDPDNPNIATRRDFDMMLRCRDTRR